MFEDVFGKSGFSLERLQALCAIAEKGSIAEATKGNANRQSQYSRQITELEGFFGIELLNRDTRPHRLNKDGTELVGMAQDFAGQLTDFINRSQNRPQHLTIGTGESTIQWLLLPDLERWKAHLPSVSINLKNLRTLDVVKELQDGEIDLGLIRKNALKDTSLKSIKATKFSYRLFVPNGMKELPKKIKIDELAELPLAVVNGSGEFRSRLAELAESANTNLNIELQLSSLTQIALAIQGGKYCGFLPEFATSLVSENICVHEVEGFKKIDRELVFAWNPKKAEKREVLKQSLVGIRKWYGG